MHLKACRYMYTHVQVYFLVAKLSVCMFIHICPTRRPCQTEDPAYVKKISTRRPCIAEEGDATESPI